MTAQFTDLTLSAPADAAGDRREPFVALEQIVPAETEQFAGMADVYRLWMAAATGTSARTLRPDGCPIEFSGENIIVRLGFYAWPSDPDLPFELSPAIGELSEHRLVEIPREFSVFVDNRNQIDLPYFMREVSVQWESPTFNRNGGSIPAPAIADNGTRLNFSTDVFGAARISGTAVGYYVEAVMTLSRPLTEEEVTMEEQLEQQLFNEDGIEYFIAAPVPASRLNGYKISNLENTITAAWQNLEGGTETRQLPLEIPQCVQDALALCPGMYQYVLRWCDEVATLQVYYNACKYDEVIGAWEGDDRTRYCSQMVLEDDPGSWLRGLR